VQNIFVSWRGGTVMTNERIYAIRLQYRVGVTNSFAAVLDANGAPVEYVRNPVVGHSQTLGPVQLPVEVNNQSYVQLRWKYYYLTGASGPRAELRVDDILVSAGVPAFSRIEPMSDGNVEFQLSGSPARQYVIEASTNLVAWTALQTMTAGANGSFEFISTNSDGFTARFFRARTP